MTTLITTLLILSALLLLLWAFNEINTERMKYKQIKKLRADILQNEQKERANDEERMEGRDVNDVIGFLNRVHEKSIDPD